MVIYILSLRHAQIAQLVEQWTENPRVTGSIPVLGTFLILERIRVILFFCITEEI